MQPCRMTPEHVAGVGGDQDASRQRRVALSYGEQGWEGRARASQEVGGFVYVREGGESHRFQ